MAAIANHRSMCLPSMLLAVEESIGWGAMVAAVVAAVIAILPKVVGIFEKRETAEAAKTQAEATAAAKQVETNSETIKHLFHELGEHRNWLGNLQGEVKSLRKEKHAISNAMNLLLLSYQDERSKHATVRLIAVELLLEKGRTVPEIEKELPAPSPDVTAEVRKLIADGQK